MGKRAHGGAWNLAITNKTIPPVVVPLFYLRLVNAWPAREITFSSRVINGRECVKFDAIPIDKFLFSQVAVRPSHRPIKIFSLEKLR